MPWLPRRRSREEPAPSVSVAVLSRGGCHLCEEMLQLVREVGADAGFTPTVRDIDAERDEGRMPAAEHDRWTTELPVLLVDGVPVARWRTTAGEVRAAVAGRPPR